MPLEITIQPKELWDEQKQEFIQTTKKATTLCLEHSLVSLSKWEAKYNKPFIGKTNVKTEGKTKEELLYYIKCMTITQNVDSGIYYCFTEDQLKQINDYINAEMTATKFYENGVAGNSQQRTKSQIITSELIYAWMISLQIPFECQRWHLNRLLTLIRVCNNMQAAQSGKKGMMNKRDIVAQNRALNAARRQKFNTKG